MSSVKASSMHMRLSLGQLKVRDLPGAIDDMSRRLDRLGAYSSEPDLAVKATKTRWMLVSTPQMSLYHSLYEK